MKKIFLTIALLLTLTGCGNGIEKVDGDLAKGEELIVKAEFEGPFVASYSQKINDFRPYNYLNYEARAILQNVHEGIYKIDQKGNYKPGIANTVKVSEEDGYLIYEVVLRDGVKFHNGKELTPEDIQYTILRHTGLIPDLDTEELENSKYWKNMVDGSTKEGFQKGKVEILGSSTIVLYLDDFYGEEVTTSIIADTAIVPEGYSEEEQKEFPIGLGAYKFDEVTADGTIKLSVFEDYYGEKPELEEIELLYLPTKEERIEKWTAGQLHLIDSYPVLEGEGDLDNLSTDIYSLVFNVDDPVFSDVELREAFYSGVDKEKIKKDVLGYSGKAVETPLSPFFSDDLEGLEIEKSYNPNRAREILAEKEGYREEYFTIAYLEEDFLSKAIGEFVRNDLVYLDLQVELLPLTQEEFNKYILKDKAYGMAIVRFPGKLDSYRIMNRFTTKTRLNTSDFYNLDYNEFFKEDVLDYQGMLDMIKADYPELYLVDPGTSYKISDYFTGPTYYPYPYLDFSSIRFVE